MVGVGASAGGLEALQTLLQYLPNDTGACYVIVQHLSPDYKSMMVELLSKYTSMPLVMISDGVAIKPNTLYLLPAKKELELRDYQFVLTDKDRHTVPNLTIDMFFKSLSEELRDRAIGIVLSGTGSDGSAGMRALKENGALAIAQKPESAKFDGMPNSAIRTGIVDLVLSPEDMGEQIKSYITHPLMTRKGSHSKEILSEQQPILDEIFAILKENSDIDFSQYKLSTIMRRIERRMKIRYAKSLSAYLSILFKDKSEVITLTKEFLIGVTQFFRDPKAFEVVKKEVIPDIVKRTPDNETIRAWVAACSTGEEVYSLAILFLEEMRRQGTRQKLKLFATDANPVAIDVGASGIYTRDIENEIPKALLMRYFVLRSDGHYQIEQKARNCVVFANHNLLNDPPFSKVDFVSCRNALIYFKTDSQKRILSSLYFALNKSGYMFLGSSENLGELSTKFESVASKYRVYKKITSERIHLNQPNNDLRVSKLPNDKQLPPVHSLMSSYKRPKVVQSIGFANEALIKESISPCILLDEQYQALHIYGDVSPYVKSLSPGRISTNIHDLINEDLEIALASALKKTKSSRKTICFTGLQTHRHGEVLNISIKVSYVKEHEVESIPGFYWVIFESSEPKQQLEVENFDVAEQAKQRIDELEYELKTNKEHLQVTIEELETTNEELQAANEELMSANEELQSTNEELQSVNEELYTVNSEYQEKISEISQANGDLDEVLSHSDIGIVFLDRSLLIRRYTEAAKKYINVMESDINRPLYHISKNISYDNLLEDVAAVSKDGGKVEKEIILENRQVLRVSIYAYEYQDLLTSKGVVITFNDITRSKYTEQSLVMAYKELHKVIGLTMHSAPAFSLDESINLLLVDDLDSSIEVMKGELKKLPQLDIKVHSAKSVSEALTILKNVKIDVCLCDYFLEKETAVDLVEKSKADSVYVPMIVVSAEPNDEFVPLLLTHGLLDLIDKSEMTSEVLEHRIKSCIQRHRLEKPINP